MKKQSRSSHAQSKGLLKVCQFLKFPCFGNNQQIVAATMAIIVVVLCGFIQSAQAAPFDWKVIVEPDKKAHFSCEPKEFTTTFTARIEGPKIPASVPGQYIITQMPWTWTGVESTTATATLTKNYTAEKTVDSVSATATFTCTPDGGACPGGDLAKTGTASVDVRIGPKGNEAEVFIDIQRNSGDVGDWNSPSDVGRTSPLTFSLDITACKDNGVWRAELISATGWYFVKVDVTHIGLQNITGPPFVDSCKQMMDLNRYGGSSDKPGEEWTSQWYSDNAVLAHEEVHVAHISPAFSALVPVAASQIAQWTVPDIGQDQGTAIQEILRKYSLDNLEILLLNRWIDNFRAAIALHGDHGNDENGIDPNAPTTIAEAGEINKLLREICNWRAGAHDPPLPPCPEGAEICLNLGNAAN